MPPAPRFRFRIITRNAIKRLAIGLLLAIIALLMAHCMMIRMPGKSYPPGALPPLTAEQAALSQELRRDVDMLAGIIGRRNVMYDKGLNQAADFIERSLSDAGYTVRRQSYDVAGVTCFNLDVEIKGSGDRADQIIIIGAHYDSVDDSPAANDNGSGVAATLALARRFAPPSPSGRGQGEGQTEANGPTALTPTLSQRERGRTLRFALFVNEEPPFFQNETMGSLVYAKACKQRGENIVGMISLETIGYYSDAPGSQAYPLKPVAWLYPDTGNFIAFVSDLSSRTLLRQAIKSFRTHAQFPSEGGAVPGWITGVGWSDHWSFWQCGYPAIMVTDTAPFRYPYYHTNQDTADKLDYDRMARVVDGMAKVIEDLAGIE